MAYRHKKEVKARVGDARRGDIEEGAARVAQGAHNGKSKVIERDEGGTDEINADVRGGHLKECALNVHPGEKDGGKGKADERHENARDECQGDARMYEIRNVTILAGAERDRHANTRTERKADEK